MTLLGEIQQAATGADESVAVLLRKCKILATRLDHPGFAEWIEHELNGYPPGARDDLPEYRKLGNMSVVGDFAGPAGSGMRHVPIPPACVTDETDRETLYGHNFTQGVAELASLPTGENLQSPWPGDALLMYGENVYEFMTCIAARRVIPPTAITGVLDAVRNRVLTFALEIERENPEAGEAAIGSQPIPQDRVDRLFNVTILGGTNVITSGDIGSLIQLPGGEWSGLRAELQQYGLGADDIETLASALAADRPAIDRGELGPATQGWLGRITAKAETGALELATNAGGGVIAGVVLRYLGLA